MVIISRVHMVVEFVRMCVYLCLICVPISVAGLTMQSKQLKEELRYACLPRPYIFTHISVKNIPRKMNSAKSVWREEEGRRRGGGEAQK